MKNKTFWSILVIVLVLVVLGFFVTRKLPEGTICTQMFCACPAEDGEFECNSCQKVETVCSWYGINIGRRCSGREVNVCEGGRLVDARIDLACGPLEFVGR